MSKFSKKILNAFTLMEIGLSLLIISILVILCIPIVVNQAKKTDEYSYYLAYKTVEKMGAQIVAYGDPVSVTVSELTSNNSIQNIFKKYVISYSDKLFKAVYPRADAAIQTSIVVSFPSYEYDYIRLCLGNTNVVKDYDEHAGMVYSQEEIEAIQAESLCQSLKNSTFIEKRYMCNGMSSSNILSELTTNTKSARQYCKWLAESCSNLPNSKIDDCGSETCYRVYVYNDISDDTMIYNKDYGECIITIHDPDLSDDGTVSDGSTLFSNPSDTTISEAISCTNYGFLNMSNTASLGDFSCSCPAGSVKAINNNMICCPVPGTGKYAYYMASSGDCVSDGCAFGTYNEKTESCCPTNSFYSPSLEKCVCAEGYTPDNAVNLTSCSIVGQNCPAGSHLETINDNGEEHSSCVTNPPIIKAERFCELVDYYWNVTTSNCNFTDNADGIAFNTNLYNAITTNNTPYLSTKAVEGAFRGIKPNIVFANGLMMWILGDKSASIPGLSFNPDHFTSNVNICHSTSDEENACSGGTKYYCKNDSRCFSINKGASEINGTGVSTVDDARNCCSTVDFADLIPMFAGDDYLRDARTYAISGFTVFIDINGSKDNDEMGGGGTLWKDVFPFYIATNGKVYPGYPLNAAKAADGKADNSGLYQGGNSSALSADVFYYDMIDNKRKKVVVYPSIPYARALCFSLEISAYTPYCQNLGSKYRLMNSENRIDKFIRDKDNPCFVHRCFIKVKNKIKFL